MSGRRLESLDGLRGVCALTVMLFHADGLFHPGPIFQHGYLAVDVFFLLSGFVIALAHEDRLRAGSGMTKFLRARGQRLLPIFWMGAAFNIPIFLWMASTGHYPGYTWAVIWIVVPITTVLMLPAMVTPDGSYSPPMLNVTWSLLVEWLVNIAYAAGMSRMRTRNLAAIAVGGWALMSIAGYFTERGWCVGFQFLPLGMLRGIAAFSAGVVIYRLHKRGSFERLPVVAPELLLTLWLCIAAVPTFAATPTFDWIAVTILSPVLIILLLRADSRTPAFFKPLGRLSYPLYVIHPGILLLAQKTPLFGLDHGPNPWRALLVAGLCIAAAWIVAALADSLPRARPRPAQPSLAGVIPS